jgi:Domain of unknown function (DUF4145)
VQRLGGDWQNVQGMGALAYQCGYCNTLVSSDRGYFVNAGLANGAIRICPGCNRPTFIAENTKEKVPGVAFGQPIGSLPKELDALYDEARRASAAGCHTLAVLGCRKLLMHIAVDQGADPGKAFLEYVEYLAGKGFVPPHGRGWVDHIRKKGNEANHEIVLMGETESNDLLTFSEMLLKFIYEFPAKVAKPPTSP